MNTRMSLSKTASAAEDHVRNWAATGGNSLQKEPGNASLHSEPIASPVPPQIRVSDGDPGGRSHRGTWSVASKVIASRLSSAIGFVSTMTSCFECNGQSKAGRFAQLIQVIGVALLATAGILVQVYTDAEQSSERIQRGNRIEALNMMGFELYDVIVLLSDEMEPFYEYNRGPYDVFLQKAQIPMRNVDSKFIKIVYWPSDVSALPVAQRGNVSTAAALKAALRATRDMRKAANGTSEDEVIRFYSGIVDNLAILVRTATVKSDRFPGWREFLTVFYTYQTYINFRKYALVGRKLAAENRTVDFDDPLYQSMLQFYNRYIEFVKITALSSETGELKIRNLTDQDTVKNVDRMHGFVLNKDFLSMSGEEWSAAMLPQQANIMWIITSLSSRVQAAMDYSATAWSTSDAFSLALFIIAAAIAITGLFVHFLATFRIQAQVVESYHTLKLLSETLTLLFDCVPRHYINSIRQGTVFAPRQLTDTCVLMMDVTNIGFLYSELEVKDFYQVIGDMYELIEARLMKYNCFKVDVVADAFCLASGIGEPHSIDHVGEMLYMALELQEDFQADGNADDDKAIRLRMGLHVGPCFARIFATGLRVPQIGIYGTVMNTAALIHATGIGMKVHVSASVYNRLSQMDEIEFLQRGNLKIDGGKSTIGTYWAVWQDGGDEHKSLTSRSSSSIRLRLN